LNHRVSTWDDTAEFAWRWNAQLLFLSALPTAIRSKVVVRLHPYAEHLSWSDRERLAEFDPDLRVDAGEQTMKTLLASSRMVIFTYNSSGFYEAMSRNYPTMGLWPLGLDGLRQSIRPIFDQLVASGILHVDPRGAAERVTEVSSEIPQWWNSDVVKEARKRFCERLARSTDTPISALKSLIAK
jgi:putative transferase (TIGR04331 family)